MQLSQSHGSFNASQSVASTSGATPTPSRSSQQSAMSLSFTNGASRNSMSKGNYGGYEDGENYGAVVPYQEYKQEYKPQIYRVRFPLFLL